MLPYSEEKTRMKGMLENLESGGWSKQETKQFHRLFAEAKENQIAGNQTEAAAAISSHTV